MKIVQINPVCGGSTGKIAVEISKLLDVNGIENYIFYTSGKSDFENARRYATDIEIKWNALLSKIQGNYGFNSKSMTKRLIAKLEKANPDIVQLHNLHGHNVNLPMLFTYLKEKNIRVFWTFHDCWSFTGYCTHFDYVHCEKWKKRCKKCIQRKAYSWFADHSQLLFDRKKSLFQGFKELTVITPSTWLAELVRNSFFSEYPIEVIHNGIDLETFKPTESNFRDKYNLQGKNIWLGVAMGFEERKGFAYFLEIAKRMDEDTRLVLVGVTKEQIAILPKNIIGIERTANQKELAEIYSAADIFLNCTLEDNFPTVNLEALACGTPVVTFETGGSPECIDETCGKVVPQKDIKEMMQAAKELQRLNVAEVCRRKAKEEYGAERCFELYLNLYKG